MHPPNTKGGATMRTPPVLLVSLGSNSDPLCCTRGWSQIWIWELLRLEPGTLRAKFVTARHQKIKGCIPDICTDNALVLFKSLPNFSLIDCSPKKLTEIIQSLPLHHAISLKASPKAQ